MTLPPPLPPLLPRAPHGGPAATAFTGLDFSVNSNPFGPNPQLLQAVRDANQAYYPDPTYHATRAKLAHWHGVTPAEIAISVGASDLLHRLARAFLPAGGGLLSLHAPFGELARAAALQRAEIQVVNALPRTLPVNVQLVYVGQPHNPTGQSLAPNELLTLAKQCEQVGALLILDLAYAPFMALPSVHHPAIVSLHSPGKVHGLVGARPAYAIAAPDIIQRLENLAPAWHVPAGTEALLAALPDAQGFLTETLPQVRHNAQELAAALRELGEVQHHGTPYLLLHVGNAAKVARPLLDRHIKVRDCASYGLPAWIRVSTRTVQQNAALIHALQEIRR